MFHQSVQSVIDQIRTACWSGREIVPLIGAGLSAETGVPTLQGMVRYLAALRGYVQERAYDPFPRDESDEGHGHSRSPSVLRNMSSAYDDNIAEYVREHDWPNYYHLYQNYGSWLRQHRGEACLDEEVASQLDAALGPGFFYPNQAAQMREMLEHAQPDLDDPLTPKVNESILWRILGRWPDLLLHVGGGDYGYARSLFDRLQRGHQPGLSHRFLAFLTRELGIRLFVSTAYDNLLERALADEEIHCTPFVMEEGRRLPSPDLIQRATAVVRMDGDLGSLVEASMYSSLSNECLRDFGRCLPKSALLLVMGTGGADRRVVELVELANRESKNDPSINRSVIWLHYEAIPPRSITQHPELDDERIDFAQVTHPGLFLSHLYSSLTTRHPYSRAPILGPSAATHRVGTETLPAREG